MRRTVGEPGGVLPGRSCSELNELFLCSIGVTERLRESVDMELELLVGRIGEGGCGPFGVARLLCAETSACSVVEGESGNGVAEAVPSERRFIVVANCAPVLFVDIDGVGWLLLSGRACTLFSMVNIAQVLRRRHYLQQSLLVG